MFSAKTYAARRNMLRTKIGSGIILLPGNSLSPNNYPNNAYYFRQDSSFRYYFGLNTPSLAGLIDADTGEEALYGDDFTVEDIIWTGPQPTLRELGAEVGVTATFPMAELEKRLRKAVSLGRKIHYLPPYRGETKLQLSALLGIKPELLHDYKSVELMFAVAEMREKKSAEEVEAMERAFLIGYQMHTLAMHMCHPGVIEREIAGAIEGIAKSSGSGLSFPRSSRSTARRSTTSTPTAYWSRGGCCCATQAARPWTATARTTRAPTPSAAGSRRSRRRFTTSYWRRTTMWRASSSRI